MAEEKKAIELDDEALDEVAGGDDSVASHYMVDCSFCGTLAFDLSSEAAQSLKSSHEQDHWKHIVTLTEVFVY